MILKHRIIDYKGCIVCINVDQKLIADQRNFRAKYYKMGTKTELKSRSISFWSFNIMSYFIYNDLISSIAWFKTHWPWINFDLRWCLICH